jgi:hypothetical protein
MIWVKLILRSIKNYKRKSPYLQKIARAANTALFMLRCVQCGISISDLDLLSIGMVNDMFIEMNNDEHKYPLIATQADIDNL